MEAFISRSSKVPQLLQVHSRSFKVSSLFMLPQTEQHFDDGSNVPIFSMFLPYHSALYSSIVTNVPHPASLIDLASLWFLSILDTCKVSVQIVWFSLINLLETLCKKSLRLFVTFSCCIANLWRVRLPLFLEYLRCMYFNLDSDSRKYLGLSKTSPLDETMKSLIPKSIPTELASVILGLDGASVSVSQSMDTKYFPVGVNDTVHCFTIPTKSRCNLILIPSLNFGIINWLSDTITFCGTLKLPRFDFFLNLGKSACPLKNFVKALSKLRIGACRDWLLHSFSQGSSFLRSGNCLIKSKQLRLTLLPAYAICLVSKARLYTKRLLPQCLCIKVFCSKFGYNLYLNALNIGQIYVFLQKQTTMFKNNGNTIEQGSRLHPIHAKAMNGFYAPFYKRKADYSRN